ncbi:MAG: hypothetical protein ACK5MI_05185 [Mangrovibacterium sp.]
MSDDAVLKSGQTTLEEDTLIASDYFRSLLNADREIQVGDFIYKVTENATFYTRKDNYSGLLEYLDKPFDPSDCRENNESQLKSSSALETNRYESITNPEIKMVDTHRLIDADMIEPDFGGGGGGSGSSGSSSGSSSTIPELKDSDFIVTSFKGTWAGKLWDSIWGFSKSVRNYWDSKNRMDAKFYSQDFGVYSEAGVKTKTQYKGWTGIWRKKDVSEIRSGYEVLILEEKWPSSVTPAAFDPVSTNYLPKTNVGHGSYYVVGNGNTEFKNETRFTVDILGFDLDVTQKDINRALYESLKAGGKFLSKDKDEVAVRILDPWGDLRKTTIFCYNKEKKGFNTDKVTFIFTNDFGGIIGYTFNTGDPSFNFNNIIAKGGAPKLNYKNGTILYGVARKDSDWEGVRFEFK